MCQSNTYLYICTYEYRPIYNESRKLLIGHRESKIVKESEMDTSIYYTGILCPIPNNSLTSTINNPINDFKSNNIT